MTFVALSLFHFLENVPNVDPIYLYLFQLHLFSVNFIVSSLIFTEKG